jgi:hypothetical protein
MIWSPVPRYNDRTTVNLRRNFRALRPDGEIQAVIGLLRQWISVFPSLWRTAEQAESAPVT